jgi:hypothetical protein
MPFFLLSLKNETNRLIDLLSDFTFLLNILYLFKRYSSKIPGNKNAIPEVILKSLNEISLKNINKPKTVVLLRLNK